MGKASLWITLSVSIFPLSLSFLFFLYLSCALYLLCFYGQSVLVLIDVCFFPHFCIQKGTKRIVWISVSLSFLSLSLSPSHLLCSNGHFGLVLFDVCLFPYFCLQNGKNIVSISDSLSFLSLSLHLPVICFAQTDSLFLFYLTSAFSRILAYKMGEKMSVWLSFLSLAVSPSFASRYNGESVLVSFLHAKWIKWIACFFSSPSHLLCSNGQVGLVLLYVCPFPHFCILEKIVCISVPLFFSLSLSPSHLLLWTVYPCFICFALMDS